MLTIAEVCERLRCSRHKVYRLIAGGHLVAHKSPGRTGALLVPEENLDAYLSACLVVAAVTSDG